jgi:virulence factor Mce-like protein
VRSRLNFPIFAGYAAVCLLVLGFLATQMSGEFMLDSYQVRAVLKTGAELMPGDDVTMSGIRVGKVESMKPSATTAEAVLKIRRDQAPLFRDARVVVRQKNLLGEVYVAVDRGQPRLGAIPDGGVIDLNHTMVPAEVDQVLSALDQPVRDRLNMAINSLGQATAGRGADMNASASDLQTMATDLKTVAHTLARDSRQLDSLIAALRKVMETLAAWHSDFKAMIADWDRLMLTLAAREEALKGTIVEQERVMSILDQALAGSAPAELHAALAEGPAALDSANHYLESGTAVFKLVLDNTPGIARLFGELASVMSGVGVADEEGFDKGKTVHMWRVYCPGQCFQGTAP